MTTSSTTLFLPRPEGRLAYDVQGTGPLVIGIPGMGDLRSTFRFLAPALVEAGHRVATFDLRGHGDSDTTFSRYDDEAAASDALALIEQLGGSAIIVGNSMGAGAAVIAAAAHPELVSGLVLVGPFVREPKMSAVTALLLRIATARPWAAPVWKSYLPSLYAGRKPADFEAYRSAAITAMRRPGYAAGFSKTTRTSHDPAEAVLALVKAPALVVMGELDPDFPRPEEEAQWISERLDARVVMVPDAGHYPQSQRPDLVNPAIVDFLSGLSRA